MYDLITEYGKIHRIYIALICLTQKGHNNTPVWCSERKITDNKKKLWKSENLKLPIYVDIISNYNILQCKMSRICLLKSITTDLDWSIGIQDPFG